MTTDIYVYIRSTISIEVWKLDPSFHYLWRPLLPPSLTPMFGCWGVPALANAIGGSGGGNEYTRISNGRGRAVVVVRLRRMSTWITLVFPPGSWF